MPLNFEFNESHHGSVLHNFVQKDAFSCYPRKKFSVNVFGPPYWVWFCCLQGRSEGYFQEHQPRSQVLSSSCSPGTRGGERWRSCSLQHAAQGMIVDVIFQGSGRFITTGPSFKWVPNEKQFPPPPRTMILCESSLQTLRWLWSIKGMEGAVHALKENNNNNNNNNLKEQQ